MEVMQMGHDPEDRQSGALLEGLEWGRFSLVEGGGHRCGWRGVARLSLFFLSVVVRGERTWLVRAPQVDR